MFENHRPSAETSVLGFVAFIEESFGRMMPAESRHLEGAKLAVKHYGATRVAKRLIDLVVRKEYKVHPLGYRHINLFQSYCRVEEVRASVIAKKGHIILLKQGWEVVKESSPQRKFGKDDFGPRQCLIAVFR